ncbi:MAG: transposase [Chloroflexi bacterium]|nr:transposase [Chloroflexota bacterium]
MQSVSRATRRRFTPEEKIRIVLEGFRRETTVNDLCRREGINPAVLSELSARPVISAKARLETPTA